MAHMYSPQVNPNTSHWLLNVSHMVFAKRPWQVKVFSLLA
jgi:hypothetical protein